MPLTWALALQESTPPAIAGFGGGQAKERCVQARRAYSRSIFGRDATHADEEAVSDTLLSPEEAEARAGQVARQIRERVLSLTNHSPRFFGMLFG